MTGPTDRLSEPGNADSLLRRERLILGACLAMLIAASWAWLFHSKAGMAEMSGMKMSNMPGMDMPGMNDWGAAGISLLFVMWAVMMVAMMTPSATPMVMAFLALNRRRRAASRPLVPVGIFLLGYLVVWSAFSAAATLAQWGLHGAALLSSAMVATSPVLSGIVLVAAGLFQWTSLKSACLKGCRTPLTFLMSEWREGAGGAFAMGLRHGVYCLGCCWILMALLFVTGVMNLMGVAAIALFVMVEKLAPRGERIAQIAGFVLVMVGLLRLIQH